MTKNFTTEWDEKFDVRFTNSKVNKEGRIIQIPSKNAERLKDYMHSRDLALEAETKKEIAGKVEEMRKNMNHEKHEDDKSWCYFCGQKDILKDVLALLNS